MNIRKTVILWMFLLLTVSSCQKSSQPLKPEEPTPSPVELVLMWPDDNLVIYGPVVRLKCDSVPNVENYQLQIASDSSFQDIVFEKLGDDITCTTTGIYTTELSPGQYWWRVNGLGEGGAQIIESEIRHFEMREMPTKFVMEWVTIDNNLTVEINEEDTGLDTTIHLEPYQIGKFEVSLLQYCIFMNEAIKAGKIKYHSGPQAWFVNEQWPETRMFDPKLNSAVFFVPILSDWGGSFVYPEQGFQDRPVFQLSWFGAKVMADFYGWRLPSHAEWLRAAKGPNLDRKWPWGDAQPTCEHLNSKECQSEPVWPFPIWYGLDPVDSHPLGQSYEGCYNLSGNVAEYTGGTGVAETMGGIILSTAVLRGGSYYTPKEYCSTNSTSRHTMFLDPAESSVFGFRVARGLKE